MRTFRAKGLGVALIRSMIFHPYSQGDTQNPYHAYYQELNRLSYFGKVAFSSIEHFDANNAWALEQTKCVYGKET